MSVEVQRTVHHTAAPRTWWEWPCKKAVVPFTDFCRMCLPAEVQLLQGWWPVVGPGRRSQEIRVHILSGLVNPFPQSSPHTHTGTPYCRPQGRRPAGWLLCVIAAGGGGSDPRVLAAM